MDLSIHQFHRSYLAECGRSQSNRT